MDQMKLEHFRRRLLDEMRRLHEEAARSIEEGTGRREGVPSDAAELAGNEERRNFELRLRDRDRKLLSRIRQMMEKIDDGTYGTCESCGEEIEQKRLEARPVATMCIDCKTEQESHEIRGV